MTTALEPVRVRMWVSADPVSEVWQRFQEVVRAEVRAALDDGFLGEVRKVVREESCKAQSVWLSVEDTCHYLSIGRTCLFNLRNARKAARTPMAKDAAFPKEHRIGGFVRFNRDELDEWMKRNAH